MPKLNSSFPSLRKHRASGQAVVTIAGKDYYLGPHGSKTAQRAYDAKIAEWLASGRSSSFGIAQDELTIAELLNSYRKFAEKYYGTGEKSTYHDMARAASRVKALYATLAISEFGPLQFKAIRQKMIDAKLARVYINKTMSFILKIFKWGMAEGMVPVEVYHRLKAVESLRMGFTEAPERDAVLPVDVALVVKTIPFLPAVVQEMVKLHLLIGCRPGELCRIKPNMTAIDAVPPRMVEILETWNIAMQQNCILTKKRKSVLAKQLKDPFFLENWRAAIHKAQKSEFCSGVNGGWHADFEWFLKEDSVVKLMEGRFDNPSRVTRTKGELRETATALAIKEFSNA